MEITLTYFTWNLGGKEPFSDNINVLKEVLKYNSDILVFGFQELEETPNMVDGLCSSCFELWNNALINNIIPAPYKIIGQDQIGAIALFVFSKLPNLTLQKITSVSLAGDGVAANKGIICIKMSYCDKTISIFGSHFEAFDSRNEYRIKEWKQLTEMIDNSDYAIMGGDLNFRITLPKLQVEQAINQKQLSYLLEFDSLRKSQKENSELQIWNEGQIGFQPTYKYDLSSDLYDTSPKQRIPSWCDRILFYSKESEKIKNLIYDSIQDPLAQCSDHRPVIAQLSITF